MGSKIGDKSFPEAVIAGFFKVAAMTIHKLASKMKMLKEQLENPAVPSSLKQLPAWLRDFSALHRRAAIFHLCQAVFVFIGVGELVRKRPRLHR